MDTWVRRANQTGVPASPVGNGRPCLPAMSLPSQTPGPRPPTPWPPPSGRASLDTGSLQCCWGPAGAWPPAGWRRCTSMPAAVAPPPPKPARRAGTQQSSSLYTSGRSDRGTFLSDHSESPQVTLHCLQPVKTVFSTRRQPHIGGQWPVGSPAGGAPRRGLDGGGDQPASHRHTEAVCNRSI